MRAILYLNVSHMLSIRILHSQCMIWQVVQFSASFLFFFRFFSIRDIYFMDTGVYQNTQKKRQCLPHRELIPSPLPRHIAVHGNNCCLILEAHKTHK